VPTGPHTSRNNELSALRSFYRWAMAYDLRDDDPTRRIDQLRGSTANRVRRR
jgi:site-specific recombinase XerD